MSGVGVVHGGRGDAEGRGARGRFETFDGSWERGGHHVWTGGGGGGGGGEDRRAHCCLVELIHLPKLCEGVVLPRLQQSFVSDALDLLGG